MTNTVMATEICPCVNFKILVGTCVCVCVYVRLVVLRGCIAL